MTEIDLGQDLEFKVTIGERVFMLREPTVGEVEAFKDSEGGLIEFLAKIGLPADVAKGLAVSKLKKLVAGIVEGLSEKK